jgi:hypothetical protein
MLSERKLKEMRRVGTLLPLVYFLATNVKLEDDFLGVVFAPGDKLGHLGVLVEGALTEGGPLVDPFVVNELIDLNGVYA